VVDGGAISSWDLRATRLALRSVLRRRPEPYHHQIVEAAHNEPIEGLADPGGAAHPPSEAEAKDLSTLIVYDDHERRSGLVRVVDSAGSAVGDFDQGPWNLEQAERAWVGMTRATNRLAVRKEIGLRGGRSDGQLWLRVGVENVGDEAFAGGLELEWNINLLGGGANPAACYRSGEEEWRHDSTGSVAPGASLSFGNSFEGIDIALNAEPAAPAEWFAVETVSNSESGFERVYQGSCLVQRWLLALAVGESATFTTTLSVTQSRDRAAEEVTRN